MRRLDARATRLVLDTRGLDVSGVEQFTRDFLGATEVMAPIWVSRPFHPGDGDPVDGTPLVIELPPSTAHEEMIRIHYETSPHAEGLHWSSTGEGGGRQPFFYTTSSPIDARSWIPTQDGPGARASYRVHVETPPNMVALFSVGAGADAKRPGAPTPNRGHDHWFVVPRPVAADRLDLVVGDLKFKALAPDVGVYGQGWSTRRDARALREAVAVRRASLRLPGGDAWSRRDYVVMPADFPFAFRSSAKLTLLSPTLIGGLPRLIPLAARLPDAEVDSRIRSAGWGDRWIAPALAGYLQSRLVESLYGAPLAALSDTLSWLRLRDALRGAPPAAQVLAADPVGGFEGPGAAAIPVDKGRLFLSFLDASFGRTAFDAFLSACFARPADQPMTSADFVDLAERNLLAPHPGVVRPRQIDAWINDAGIPAAAALPAADELRPVDAAREAWLARRATAAALGAQAWPAENWLYFLGSLPQGLDAARLAELDAAYHPMKSGDAEVESAWLSLAIREDYQPAFTQLEAYLKRIGRIGLIAPLYAGLMRSPAGADLARRVYLAARPGYDSTAAAIIDAIVTHRTGTDDHAE
ncbi:MAG: leukotriene A4 hydrolase C-terminal domain-containing protein [Gammaproteobacteria bacterium]|nr:leukotriene A4 hydrolase C-terminal domain-containing protein [Gammaproteobacteria bacterium]